MISINQTTDIALILLAAGGSSRLGSPKQLLKINEKYLLQHVIDQLAEIGNQKSVIVLGAFNEEISDKIDFKNFQIIQNKEWKQGLSTSIRKGVEAVLEINPDTEAIILVLCDQVFITTSVINDLINKHVESGKSIINCRYENGGGPPVLFHKKMFPYLSQLSDNNGAKNVVQQFPEELAQIEFTKGHLDLDTKSDYEQFLIDSIIRH